MLWRFDGQSEINSHKVADKVSSVEFLPLPSITQQRSAIISSCTINQLRLSNSISFHISRLAFVQFLYNFFSMPMAICTAWKQQKCKQNSSWLCAKRKEFPSQARVNIEKLFAIRHALKLIQINEWCTEMWSREQTFINWFRARANNVGRRICLFLHLSLIDIISDVSLQT